MSVSLNNTNSNILYEIKKQSLSKASLYQPNQQDDSIRQQNAKLRTKNRSLQTQIARLKGTIDQLKQKILIFQNTQKLDFSYQHGSSQHQKSNFLNNSMGGQISKVPMLLENNQLRQSNQILHKENLSLNGKNNQLEAKNRQTSSQCEKLKRKLKELQIIQKMRAERFQDELDRMTPIIIQEPSEFTALKKGVTKMADVMRERIVETAFYIFQISAKQCENNKKVSSFTIFLNYWQDLKRNKQNGFGAIVSCYKNMKKLVKMVKQNYLQEKKQEQQSQPYRDTMNEWILNNIIEIKNAPQGKDPQSKLFRSLGLKYRSRFPIKGEVFEIDQDVLARLQDFICLQIQKLLLKSP